MPRKETPNPREIRGDSPPTIKAAIGQKYRDTKTQKAYWMTGAGWELASSLNLEPSRERKNRWVVTANSHGMTLEEWIFGRLP